MAETCRTRARAEWSLCCPSFPVIRVVVTAFAAGPVVVPAIAVLDVLPVGFRADSLVDSVLRAAAVVLEVIRAVCRKRRQEPLLRALVLLPLRSF